MQELMQVYDEKLDTPDCSHVYEARWVYVASDWIRQENPCRSSVL